MADKTLIEWTDATWNPVTGCDVVSPGCTNCYAMRLAGTRMKHHPSRQGLTRMTKAGPVWNGEVRFNEDWLLQPLGWKRPRMVFTVAHGDLFHEAVPDASIDKIFAVMALCPQHTFQLLTKRPQRMLDYLTRPAGNGKQDTRNHIAWVSVLQVLQQAGIKWQHLGPQQGWRARAIQAGATWPLPNVWLGVSAEDQRRADERIPLLLRTPAAKRFLSAEPMLGPVSLESSLGGTRWVGGQRGCDGTHRGKGTPDCPREPHHHHDDRCRHGLDWVIAGGESGPNARPSHPDWLRQLRDHCVDARVPFFFKQWGEWWPCAVAPHPGAAAYGKERIHRWPDGQASMWVGKKAAGNTLDGRTWLQLPAQGEQQ